METISGIFAAVPLDYFLLGAVAVVVALDTMRSGIGRAAALAVALPVALLLHSLLGTTAFIGNIAALDSGMMQAAVFGAILALSYLLVRRMGLEYVDGGMGQPIQSLIAGVALAVIFAVIWQESAVLGVLWQFDSPVTSLFAGSYRLFWLLGAYAALAFARG
ncbi:MAG: hypothetical protein AAB734_01645 [Patescibacteria group bacterium]